VSGIPFNVQWFFLLFHLKQSRLPTLSSSNALSCGRDLTQTKGHWSLSFLAVRTKKAIDPLLMRRVFPVFSPLPKHPSFEYKNYFPDMPSHSPISRRFFLKSLYEDYASPPPLILFSLLRGVWPALIGVTPLPLCFSWIKSFRPPPTGLFPPSRVQVRASDLFSRRRLDLTPPFPTFSSFGLSLDVSFSRANIFPRPPCGSPGVPLTFLPPNAQCCFLGDCFFSFFENKLPLTFLI